MNEQLHEQKFLENVNKAKELIKKRKGSQMIIAGFALEVCEISWGGPQFRGKYTLARFARESGISARTLSNWVGVRLKVYDKAPKSIVLNSTFTELAEASAAVSRDASAVEVKKVLIEQKSAGKEDRKLVNYLKWMKSISYSFSILDVASRMDRSVAEEYLFYTNSIVKSLKSNFPDLKPKHNGIGAKGSNSRESAANALGLSKPDKLKNFTLVKGNSGTDIRITPKDRDIANFLKKQKRFCSPTEIGMKLKGHNRSSASAWAYRTLNKLTDTNHVERNEKGLYRWVE